jgi:uncharacterized repeat protein (TIGR03803 family)
MDSSGNLYGSTTISNTSSGTAFELSPVRLRSLDLDDTVLLRGGAAGNLYGATISGGSHGFGTVFQIAP